MSWELRFVGSRDILDFKFQIKEPSFSLHSLESPTNSVFQKDNFDCDVAEEEREKRLFRNQERYSKSEGDRI